MKIHDRPERVRSQAHLRAVRGEPCLRCGSPYPSAHHLQFAQPRAKSLKTGDQYTVPLCHKCHMLLHAFGDERLWWDLEGIDPIAWAERFYKERSNA